jgi:hypothetical protein
MGRPIHKKYFGNTNIASTGEGTGGEGVASVTVAGEFSGFAALTTTVTFSAPEIAGGETATGTATIVGGAVTAIVSTNSCSGYTAVPTVTVADSDAGAEVTTGTLTAVLTTGASARQNAIAAYAFVTAGSNKLADILKQEASRRYRVRTADGIQTCVLVTDGVANAAGEMTITATDSSSKTYYVKKLTARKAILIPFGTAGHEFTSGASVKWTFGSAVLNSSVTIANN